MKDVWDLLVFKDTDKFPRTWNFVFVKCGFYILTPTELRFYPNWQWQVTVVLN